MKRAASNSFRRTLATELKRWLSEGLISGETAARLRDDYELDALSAESSKRLAWAIFAAGVLLIGCGVAALVAYNWEVLPGWTKILGVTFLMLASHAGGYWLWFEKDRPRLGHALVLLGTLIFFADIAVTAQVYNVSSDGRGAWFALVLGACAVTLAVRSTPNFVVATWGALAWGFSWPYSDGDSFPVMALLLPLVYLGVGAWHVARTGSVLSLIIGYATSAFLAVTALDRVIEVERCVPSFLVFFAMLAPIIGSILDRPGERHRLSPPLFWLGLLLATVLAFVFSFLDAAHELSHVDTYAPRPSGLVAANLILALGGVAIAAVREWSFVRGRPEFPTSPLVVVLPSSLLLSILYTGLPLAVAANLVLVAWTVFMGKTGVDGNRNGRFWYALILGNLLILARFFEYDTNLLVKAAAFIAAGAAVIVGGLWFERRKRMTS